MEGNANLHTGQKSSNVILTSKCPIKLNHVFLTGKNVLVFMGSVAISNTKLNNNNFQSSVMDIETLSTTIETIRLAN